MYGNYYIEGTWGCYHLEKIILRQSTGTPQYIYLSIGLSLIPSFLPTLALVHPCVLLTVCSCSVGRRLWSATVSSGVGGQQAVVCTDVKRALDRKGSG